MKEKIWEKVTILLKMPLFYFCVIFIISNIMFTRYILNSNGLNIFWPVLAVELVIEGIIIALLILAEKRNWPIERKFLLMAISLGALFLVFLPPGQTPDEISHFRRAYGISEGVLIASDAVNEQGAIGSAIPVETYMLKDRPEPGSYKQVAEWLAQGQSGETSDQPYTNTALYNFLCYLPQVLASFVGRALGLSVIGIAYLMSVFNFAVWVLLVYFAIKIIPKFKTMLLFIALLPITLQEATSLAPDALAIGLGLFLVAYVMYLSYEKKTVMSKKELALLYIIAIVIGLCKIVYFPLVLLFVTIPAERFGSKKKKWIHLGIIAVLTLAVNLSWLAISSSLLIEFNPGVDSKAQVAGILSNPFKYLMVMFRTVSENGSVWMQNMLGTVLGSFKFNMPLVMFLVAFSFWLLILAQRDESLKLKKYDRLVYIIVFFAIVLLIMTSLYVQWTAVGAEKIDGIQGRYFLPILILLPVMICRTNNKKTQSPIISQNTVLYYSLFMNVIAVTMFFAQNA